MSDQQRLFYDTENDALRACIAAAGGAKTVAHKLWPAMKQTTAATRIAACLDESRNEKFTLAEIIAIGRLGRDAGCHALMIYMGAELAYEVRALAAKDQLATALDVFNSVSTEMLHAMEA